MKTRPSGNSKNSTEYPRKIRVGRFEVTIYRRLTPSGNAAFMVGNYATGKRRFDSYSDEGEALEAANRLARQMSERNVLAASMTNGQAAEYASAVQTLAPFNVTLSATASIVAECLKIVGGLADLHTATKFYAARHKRTVAKPVLDVVSELLAVKEARSASARYLEDLRYRLNRFADAFRKDTCNVTTADVQAWFDGQKLPSQSYTNFRRVISLLFEFAAARGYASDNPVEGVESVKIRSGDIQVFTPAEIARLLEVAPPAFLPSLAIGAFSGLRSAEIERLEWSDVRLAERHIVVSAGKSKTASRRIVPISDNLAAWLAPYAERQGSLWAGTHKDFYKAQQDTAAATEVKEDAQTGQRGLAPVKWKANGLRHSYASYRFALIGDAGRLAGELGNSAAVVHRHYRELVKLADARKWFAVRPAKEAANVIPLAASA